MSLTFSFALSQQQTFELRCDYGTRTLQQTELITLLTLCEEKYYAQESNRPSELQQIGKQLHQWLDGKEGWLRKSQTDNCTIDLNLIQTSDVQTLNPDTERVALGLTHFPWELLHNGTSFLLPLPLRTVHHREANIIGVQNRPLRLLFMATSPEHPGVNPLRYEAEETNILQATKDQPLALLVEESGSVAELGNLVQSYPEDHFDIFHLTEPILDFRFWILD